jgi:hypothetical protein
MSFLHAPSTLLIYNLLGKTKDFYVSLLISYVCVYEKGKKEEKLSLSAPQGYRGGADL